MEIKITFTQEGPQSFRIAFKNDLPEDYEPYYDDIQVEDVIVDTTDILLPENLEYSLHRAIEFLTVNAFQNAGHVADSYFLQEYENNDDTLTI